MSGWEADQAAAAAAAHAKSGSLMRKLVQMKLPMLHMTSDDTMSTPWTTTVHPLLSSSTREPLPRVSMVRTSISGGARAGSGNVAQRLESLRTVEDAEAAAGLMEKLRRLVVLQRRKYKELLKMEEDAFKSLVRQAESSVESITSFVAFRERMEASAERQRKLMVPWLECRFADNSERLIQDEWEARQSIISYERRLRDAKQLVEWMTGAAMRFKRAMEVLLHGEECRRKFIERAEMREAREIPVLRPFVVVFENLGVLGKCPFLSVQDCPFFCRGEGVRNSHYEVREWGRR
ncbi:hypothetical protein DQ04_04011050 [Trypanosoma grayi]|uniref:hypothetical protein n=1 Tax=Trypanosoma grayi TaxID=71804 RepID=UPI0004F4AB3A|nr:hypothetical protein DQ04_04011050 [Trypanosoma grayi]KEG10232.1 hypothetical protein DQ04_04011050 [Trypanosoma grayi]